MNKVDILKYSDPVVIIIKKKKNFPYLFGVDSEMLKILLFTG